MRILVTGAAGFIGRGIIEALLGEGHVVVACCRTPGDIRERPGLEPVALDLRDAVASQDWHARLDGVDAVVNAAGILREQRRGDFDHIHHTMPLALVEACRARGIRFVQVSALGDDADGDFIRSKHRFDETLLALDPQAWVIRPSVVVSTRGSYGGTSLLRALSALPGCLPVPGAGNQRIQPILLEDLAALVARCMRQPPTRARVLHAVGPEVMTIRDYLVAQRAWLRLPPARVIPMPTALVTIATAIGERFGRGPLGATIAGMLERGNIGPPGALTELEAATSFVPRPVSEAWAHDASFVQDRWHARLHLLRPFVRAVIVTVWIVSGIAGLLATPAQYGPILSAMSVPAAAHAALVIFTSVLDIALAVALLLASRRRPLVLVLMLVSVLAYTLGVGLLAPALWLDPLGGLLKNLAIAGLLLVALAIEDAR